MLKKVMLALAGAMISAGALAANTPDDFFVEKIRFIQYHAPKPPDYQNGVQQLIQSVNQSDGPLMGALGRAFMRMKDYRNAQGVLLSTIRINPSNADAQADLAFVSATLYDCTTARGAYERAVALNPTAVELRHVQMARTLCPGM